MADNLTPEILNQNLPTRFIGQRVLCFDRVTSTNEIARRETAQKAPEGTVVIAECQTAGRGRLKRSWVTAEGNIALSIILYPPRKYLYTLTMVASLAVADAIESTTGLKCDLKWPNDVLIKGKKVCGILIETSVKGETVDYAVIGIGINVNMRLVNYPEIQSIATSLSDDLGRKVDRVTLLRQLFIEVEKQYLAVLSGENIIEKWRERLVTMNKPVRVRAGEDIYEGIAESVAEDGSLLLRRPDGTLMKFMAGDVSLR